MVAAWIGQLARGILALALGLTITLTLEHSPSFGLLTFGAFAILAGMAILAATLGGSYAGQLRGTFLGQGVATLAAGIVAVAMPGAGVGFLALVVGVWAAVTGLLEGASGILSRSWSPLARDWIITGALTVALGVVAVVLPRDVAQAFAGEQGNSGMLTSSVILIGVVGAWAMLVGMLQVISAVTVRSDRSARANRVVTS